MTPTGRRIVRPVVAVGFLGAGLLVRLIRVPPLSSHLVWTIGLWLVGAPILLRTTAGVLRGRFAADLVAGLAILSAMALDQPFAGLVIALMQTGGEALEHFAERRASTAVRALEEDAPRVAHRLDGDRVEDVAASAIAVNERILVRPGEMLPCDGVVESGAADLDVSRMTGEPLPQRVGPGDAARSGSLVVGSPLVVRATARADASLYARIVELVRTAQASKAPLQRVADRVAIWFTPLTIIVAAGAYLISRDPLRVLAVLVVATPCPLILATPVAIIGGINRAARRQIIVRHGGALEALAAVDTAVFDKTGTLTVGRPQVSAVQPVAPFDEPELLALAAAVEQGSGHLLARTLVEEALRRGLPTRRADHIVEAAGRGVTGEVDGRRVTVGAFSFIREREPAAAARLSSLHDERPALRAYVAVDGAPAGSVTYADQLRPDAAEVVARLRSLGLTHVALLSGDHAENVSAVAREVGIDEVAADLLPEDKVAHVHRLVKSSRRILMVGDGTNDAPALSAASVGLALAAHGGGIAAEAADVVLLVDALGRVPEAVAIGRRTMRVARQSIAVGLGLSGAAMVVAAAGALPPAIGALVQELIDVAVIVNALRTSAGSRPPRAPLQPALVPHTS